MGESSGWIPIEGLEAFRRVEAMCDSLWDIISTWRGLARDTLGAQLVRSADSVGANLVEGDGRYSYRDKLNHCYNARGPLVETRYWVNRAFARKLIDMDRCKDLFSLFDSVQHWINALISQRRQRLSQVRENEAIYHPGDEA
ncbi:MAG TPA: four helix bundle protein [Anaerolineales bacterium]